MANVKDETIKAYYDSANPDMKFGETTETRDLDFLASKPVSVDWAVEVMEEATPNGYNYFQPRTIRDIASRFAGEPKIILAREASVAIYVIGDKIKGVKGMADEHSSMSGREFIQSKRARQERRDGESQKITDEIEDAVRGNMVHRFWWD